jgi:hypothetical protein
VAFSWLKTKQKQKRVLEVRIVGAGKRFPLKTGFRSFRVAFKEGLTVLRSGGQFGCSQIACLFISVFYVLTISSQDRRLVTAVYVL